MSEKDLVLAALGRTAPNTFEGLQHLVMAMDDYVKSMGKRTLFGKEKSPAAYEKYLQHLQRTILGMQRDGQITPTSSSEEIIEKLRSFMALFRRAFPNWPDAYLFFDWATTDDKANTSSIISKLV